MRATYTEVIARRVLRSVFTTREQVRRYGA